ncbi:MULTISPECIES: DUF4139 domain-containing protein [Streptomyces]|uniref:DUF4139 domain-containing protein n=2 Tax=Streptomyces TaxID=1883 RepID=A0A117IXR8_9ACTN|nr:MULTISPECIES: DUF4139 domain-containing protein [Streptomyces]KUH40683.1 hypothetical protein ATE80_00395 [Streptomyces kanasensis]UUS29469.1 DUF4139 domain-containing protein [Streptomyces changanensis]
MTAGTTPGWTSVLDAVVVYAQGAVCRRLARGGVPQDGRVRVTGLPRTLDPGSLRARVVGASGVRVTEARVAVEAEPSDTETGTGIGTDTGSEAGTPDALRREVERLRDECAATRGRRDRQLGLIGEVAALRPVPPVRRRDDPHRRTPVDAWLELADFVDERLAGLHARLAELEEDVRRVEHELDIAADRLGRASTDAPAAHVDTTVSVLLTLTRPTGAAPGTDTTTAEVEVEVEYGVPGAVWVPTYRLAHRRGDTGGLLLLRAAVAQRTGEDWTGVRVALATADLRRATDLPRLRSLRIGRRQPAPAPSGWRVPPAGLGELFAGYDATGPRPATTATTTAAGAATVASAGAVTATAGAAAGAGPAPAPRASAAGPVPPPPPAPLGYGAPPAAFAVPGGAPPQPFAGAASAPAAPVRSRPDGRPRTGGRAAPPAGPSAPAGSAAPGRAAAPPSPAPAGPPQPSGAELDYAALVLCGPDDRRNRRGRLFPDPTPDPVAAEYRRHAEAVAALPLPGNAVRPRESAGSFDHRYDCTARADIPSDGTWHTVTVGEITVGLRTEYLCVPSVEPTVYATLVLSNATDQALLAGPVDVTVDDEFLLTAALPTLAPGGVRLLGLGPAEGVRVTRGAHLRESTAGLRGTTTVLDHRVHVELANSLTGPVTVEVRERVPVTSEPDVRIEERADWSVPDDGTGPDRHAPGTRVWRVDLPAGGTAALEGGYEIRIPAGKALVGGNRRS